MRYKCLVLDHDDTTVVNSTATIHYPCFCEFLKEVRPQATHYTLKIISAGTLTPASFRFHGRLGCPKKRWTMSTASGRTT